MSVGTELRETEYEGNDATYIFPVDFPFKDSSQLKVYLDDVLLVLGTHYTVDGGGGSTGNVTFLEVPADGEIILIKRTVPWLQPTGFSPNGPYSPVIHERALDNLEYQIQQLRDELTALQATTDLGELTGANVLYRTLEGVVAADDEPTFAVPAAFTVRGISVIKVVETVSGNPVAGVVSVQNWTQAGVNVTCDFISGIEEGEGLSYRLELLVFGVQA